MRFRAQPSALSGTIRAPPSKSYTHRTILTAALSGGPCRIARPLLSEDTEATISGIEALGAEVARGDDGLTVSCEGLRPPIREIDARNSGTTLRLLSGIAALLDGPTVLTGDASLRTRPMGPLLDALIGLGAKCRSLGPNGCPPVEIRGPIRGGEISIPGFVSSQFISSLLIACPLAPEFTSVRVLPPLRSEPYVEVTLHVLERFGVAAQAASGWFYIPGRQAYHPVDFTVPGDFSSATFAFVAAAITRGDVTVEGLDSWMPQGDRRILRKLEAFGVAVETYSDRVRVRGEPLRGQTVDIGDTPDLFPALAVLATQAAGESRFVNGEHLRLKESDRIESTVAFLKAMGADVQGTRDGCIVRGPTPLREALVDSRGDHRILMAAAVAGLVADGPVDITNPMCYRVSYPSFLEDFQSLGAKFEVVS